MGRVTLSWESDSCVTEGQDKWHFRLVFWVPVLLLVAWRECGGSTAVACESKRNAPALKLVSCTGCIQLRVTHKVCIGRCIQKFPDWPPGARTANGTALWHWVQLYCYVVSQSSEFCRHNPLCCFSTSVYYCCLFLDSVRKLLDIPSYAGSLWPTPFWIRNSSLRPRKLRL
jgi:hypothetical protein